MMYNVFYYIFVGFNIDDFNRCLWRENKCEKSEVTVLRKAN